MVLDNSTQEANLQADTAAAATIVQNDQTAIQTAATNGLAKVTAEYQQIAADAGNAINVANDQAQLAVDQAAYQGAVSTAVAQLQADQVSTQNQIAADNAAITALLNSSPAYTSAVAKQTADQAADNLTSQIDQDIVTVVQAQTLQDIQNYGSGISSGSVNTTGGGILSLHGSDAQTEADQDEINLIQSQLTADQSQQSADLARDNATVNATYNSTIYNSAPENQLIVDGNTAATITATQQRLIIQAVRSYLPAVLDGYVQLAEDQGHVFALRVTQTNLNRDQTALRNAAAGAFDQLQSEESAAQAAIAADQAALTALLNSTPAYTSALAQLQSDTTADANKVQTDQAILSAAQAKLATDQANAPSVWNTGAGGTLTINGGRSLNVGTTGSLITTQSGTLTTIGSGSGTIILNGGGLTVSGTGATASGTLSIGGSALISGTTVIGNGILTLAGTIINSGTLIISPTAFSGGDTESYISGSDGSTGITIVSPTPISVSGVFPGTDMILTPAPPTTAQDPYSSLDFSGFDSDGLATTQLGISGSTLVLSGATITLTAPAAS
jgi:hypothetical protein